MAPAGDINQDGVNDLVVSAVGSAGDVIVVYGKKDVRTGHEDTKTADVTIFTYEDSQSEVTGHALDGGKDLNGDGIPYLLLGVISLLVLRAEEVR